MLTSEACKVQSLPTSTVATCAQCREFDNGLCKLRARADWGDASFVSPLSKACDFADLLPF